MITWYSCLVYPRGGPYNTMSATTKAKVHILQASNWDVRHEGVARGGKGDPLKDIPGRKWDEDGDFVLRAFARSERGNHVEIVIRDFKPDFYFNLPAGWDEAELNKYMRGLQGKVGGERRGFLVESLIGRSLMIRDSLFCARCPISGQVVGFSEWCVCA